jgi:hypothetical protein
LIALPLYPGAASSSQKAAQTAAVTAKATMIVFCFFIRFSGLRIDSDERTARLVWADIGSGRTIFQKKSARLPALVELKKQCNRSKVA